MTKHLDDLILEFDHCLRALLTSPSPERPMPRPVSTVNQNDAHETPELNDTERRHAAGLMRVNHVGEVCAQALYRAQALATDKPALRAEFQAAAQEEGDHLAWTAQRLNELQSRPSLLNPLWYVGAFSLGWFAGKASDAISLGFVVETEHQVEQHLASHLEHLPEKDHASRAIVEQMRLDEIRHGQAARASGAATLPSPVQAAMRVASKIMTTTAYRV